LLCTRCATFNQAHAQVDRARQAVYERTRVARGAVDYYMKVAERTQADEDAARDHATFSAIQAAGPAATPTAAECSRCGNTFPVERMTYALDGRQMCTACHATYDERAERRKIEGTSTTGFLLGFFLSAVGVWIVLRRNKPAESAGLLFGVVAGTILLYIPAVFALLSLWRR
jgi:hypothetical protein